MESKGFHQSVRAVAYPVCIFSSLGFVLVLLAAIWLVPEGEPLEFLFQLISSFLALAMGSAIALGATAAYKNAK